MKRLLPLVLALVMTAGCGQPQETEAPVANAAPEAAAPSQNQAAASETAVSETAASEAAAVAEAAPAGAQDEPIELAQVDLSSVEALGFIEGRHYRRLSPTQATSSSPDQVEVTEFFMYVCPHCYNIEPYVEAWLEDKPDYINFVRTPTTWNQPPVPLHAQAFYTAATLGKIDEMHMPFFQEYHVNGNALETPDKLAEFFGRFGVNREEFESTFESFIVNTRLRQAAQAGERYRVGSTPTFIVNGKYTLDLSTASYGLDAASPERMFELIEALAAAEVGR